MLRGNVATNCDAIAVPASPDLAWLRRDLRQLMSRDVGVLRSDASLARAAAFIGPLRAQTEERLLREGLSLELLELRNLALAADLIVRAASARGESRGAHFNRDRPGADAVDSRPRAPAVTV